MTATHRLGTLTEYQRPDYSAYSKQQLAAARMMADLSVMHKNKEIAEAVGISERQLYRWKEEPEFLALVNYLSEMQMDAFLAQTYRAIQKAVNGGSVKAMELVLKRAGKLIDRKEVSGAVDVNQNVSLTGVTLDELEQRIAAKERELLAAVETVEVEPDTFAAVIDAEIVEVVEDDGVDDE